MLHVNKLESIRTVLHLIAAGHSDLPCCSMVTPCCSMVTLLQGDHELALNCFGVMVCNKTKTCIKFNGQTDQSLLKVLTLSEDMMSSETSYATLNCLQYCDAAETFMIIISHFNTVKSLLRDNIFLAGGPTYFSVIDPVSKDHLCWDHIFKANESVLQRDRLY